MDLLKKTALELAANRAPTPAEIERVAKQTNAEAARWAFAQWELRKRGAAKFALASQMLFDRDGLEMATHEAIAAYHASLFPVNATVFDLTAGLGADLIALANRGQAIGFETDAERASLCLHNLSIHPQKAKVSPESFETLQHADYFFADPARRDSGRRTLDPSQFEPNPLHMFNHFKDARLGVMKLSPMLPDEFLESMGVRLEFLSFRGECREALVMIGAEAKPGRVAVHLESGSVLSTSDEFVAAVEEPAEFIFEADPAAIRAHSLATLATEFELQYLADSNGYLTGSQDVASPWLCGFRVLSSGRFDVGSLKRELKHLGSGTPILKQRGVKQNLQDLRKKLLLSGQRALTVAIYPVGKSLRQAIMEPLR